jgi:hypothetical protein
VTSGFIRDILTATATITAVIPATGPAIAAAGTWRPVPVPNAAVRFSNLRCVDGRTDTDAWAVGYVQPPACALRRGCRFEVATWP